MPSSSHACISSSLKPPEDHLKVCLQVAPVEQFQTTRLINVTDMDVIFALAHIEGVSPVSVSLRKDIPPAGSPEADRILGFGSETDTARSSSKERISRKD
jgi:hypothetical protein